jgi:branched-subunit amino acid aminotransferase/4-amino-4-deoxychorismate lyase
MGKQLFAPNLSHTGIASTSRKRLLNHAQALGYDVQIGRFPARAVMQADEVLVMNAIQGIAYLSRLDDHPFAQPSLITELLQQD